jgi:hypothetical protein
VPLELRGEVDAASSTPAEELRERLRRLTPSMEVLEEALDRLPGAEGLSARERLAVLRGLERVWHIMRLLRLLSEYFGGRMVFGGGSILNYIYMVGAGEPPRLTFDLDASWYRRVAGKRVILREMVEFNRWLVETGNTLKLPVGGGRFVELYIVEYDVEKDYFPDLLSLRVPVVTRYDGRPFYQFLGVRDYSVIMGLRSVFEEVLGVRDARIDYIRLDVSLAPLPVDGEGVAVRDLFGFEHRVVITPLEYQLASKIEYKLGRDFGDALKYNIHDILKALLDLRLLEHVDPGEVAKHIRSPERVRQTLPVNVEAVLRDGRRLWERNYHYTLVRRRHRLEEVVEKVERMVYALLR